MPLQLAVPERTAPAKDLELRPKQVKAWIDSLPLAQSIDTARRMAGHLAQTFCLVATRLGTVPATAA